MTNESVTPDPEQLRRYGVRNQAQRPVTLGSLTETVHQFHAELSDNIGELLRELDRNPEL